MEIYRGGGHSDQEMGWRGVGNKGVYLEGGFGGGAWIRGYVQVGTLESGRTCTRRRGWI